MYRQSWFRRAKDERESKAEVFRPPEASDATRDSVIALTLLRLEHDVAYHHLMNALSSENQYQSHSSYC